MSPQASASLQKDEVLPVLLAEQMDELLQRCFLQALKCCVRKADLLLLTSTLLGSHMFSCWVRRVWGAGAGGPSPAPPWSDGTRPTGLSEEHDVESGK